MKKVVDESGRVIKNLYRSNNGILLVDDKSGANEYQRKVREAQRVQDLEKELDELRNMVKTLLEKQHG